jgi:hypothetical protein
MYTWAMSQVKKRNNIPDYVWLDLPSDILEESVIEIMHHLMARKY